MPTMEHLKKWVNIRIDEFTPGALDFESIEPVIDDLDQEIENSMHELIRLAPRERIYRYGQAIPMNNAELSNGKLLIEMPEDWLRFLRVELPNWNQAVDFLTSVDAEPYRRATHRYMAPTNFRPFVALIPGTENMYLDCRPADGDTSIGEVEAIYVPEVPATDVDSSLEDVLVWLAVSRTFQIIRQPGLAQQARQKGLSLLQPPSEIFYGQQPQEDES